jgi:hypothetical protein
MNCGLFAEMFKTDPKKTSLEINNPLMTLKNVQRRPSVAVLTIRH